MKKNKIIQFNSVIDGVQKKKDGTLSIKLGTQELKAKETALIFDMGNKYIHTVFSEVDVNPDDIIIPEIKTEFRSDKSPSQRLRNSLYVFWKNNTSKQKTFEEFYKQQMEKFIETVKDKII